MRNRWGLVTIVLAVLTVLFVGVGIISSQKQEKVRAELVEEQQLAQQIENLSLLSLNDASAQKELDEMLEHQKTQLPSAAFDDVEGKAASGISSGITDAVQSSTEIAVNAPDASARALATEFASQWLEFAQDQNLNDFESNQALSAVTHEAKDATCQSAEQKVEEDNSSLTALVKSLDATGYFASLSSARADIENTAPAVTQRIEAVGKQAQSLGETLRSSTECGASAVAQLPAYELPAGNPATALTTLETQVHDNALAFLSDEKFSGENFKSARATAVLAAVEL